MCRLCGLWIGVRLSVDEEVELEERAGCLYVGPHLSVNGQPGVDVFGSACHLIQQRRC